MFHYRKRLYSFFLEKYITLEELECDKLGNKVSLLSVDRGNSHFSLTHSPTQTLTLILIFREIIFEMVFNPGEHRKLNFSKF